MLLEIQISKNIGTQCDMFKADIDRHTQQYIKFLVRKSIDEALQEWANETLLGWTPKVDIL